MQSDLHRHEFFEMIYVARGLIHNELSTERMDLRAGDLLIIKPYVRHLLRTDSERPSVQAYCCSFLPRIVDSSINGLEDLRESQSPNRYFFKPFLSLADDNVSAVKIRIPGKYRKNLQRLFQNVQDAPGEKSGAVFARRRCHFLDLLATLSDIHIDMKGETGTDPKVLKIATSRYHQGLRKALNYIHSNFSEPLTLQDMAEMSGVSVSYFSMLMKHSTGMSFVNYLTGLRMDQACSLLRGSTENIMDICYGVGFNDYSHFSRKFKEITGYTPREFRQQKDA
ncbi:helix-turn-helix domain-containing protein [Luteolibacter algae]|uniref:Helix-turn-helix domain-containing protein n=1 Tax=Luteolibacter algae TaxID=454151 RepID=A0ABW5D864_9BACT